MTALSALTFNAGLLKVQVLGWTVFENPQFAAERLPFVGRALSSAPVLADIVCLQEVYTDTDAAVICRALEQTHPHVVRVNDVPTPLPKLHNGLMILSRWPLAQDSVVLERFVEASRAEQWMGNKSILKASFQVPDLGPSLVTVLTTHLTSGGEHPESDAPSVDEVRGAELVQLRRMAEASAAKGDIVIIAGDFNCGPSASEENYRSLLEWTDDTYVAARDIFTPVTPACTWDPTIYLNRTNIHAACPANRLDLILLVPPGPKWQLNIDNAAIILTEPCVPVSSSSGDPILVTLSDHYCYRSAMTLSLAPPTSLSLKN
jgi:endonuclease/exonuclease/phosphatase family metal-dependent hydrolase